MLAGRPRGCSGRSSAWRSLRQSLSAAGSPRREHRSVDITDPSDFAAAMFRPARGDVRGDCVIRWRISAVPSGQSQWRGSHTRSPLSPVGDLHDASALCPADSRDLPLSARPRLRDGHGRRGVATRVASVVAEGLGRRFQRRRAPSRAGARDEVVSALGPVASRIDSDLHAHRCCSWHRLPRSLAVDAALFFVPALAAQRWFGLYQEQRGWLKILGSQRNSYPAANLSFANGLVATLDARDRYTAGHSAAVAVYARDIASRMDLAPKQHRACPSLRTCPRHREDRAAGGLARKAWRIDTGRAARNAEAFRDRSANPGNVDTYAEIAAIVRHHHERVDGQGYPDGLADDDIPLCLEDHRCRRCVQRDDVGSTVSRRHAKSSCSSASCAGSRDTIRYGGRRGIRGDPGWRG